MRVYAYIRYSTEHKEDTPDVQLAVIKTYCDCEGLNLVNVYTDQSECKD